MSGSTADRLVAAARDVLVAEGSAAVSMRRVAAAVGVTPMATYRHFANRDALLEAVADSCQAELGRRWARYAEVGGFEERLAGLHGAFLDFALGSPHLYRFLMVEPRARARRFPQDFAAGASPTFGVVTEAVERGMREGVLRDADPLEVTLAITAHGQGLIELYLGGRIGLSEHDFRALCVRSLGMVLDGLRA
ncbi:MAG: TetR/AcrR family transcriptional regulator [Pseudonocardia sp.]